MKSVLRKTLSLLLAVLMAFGAVAVGGRLEAEAISQSDAVAWAKAQGDNRTAFDLNGDYGNGGYQCSDFASAYMNYLMDGNPYSGRYKVYNANYYDTVASWDPTHWEVIQNYAAFLPQPGDIFVSEYGTYGHVGVVISSNTSTAVVVDQNTDSNWNYYTGSPCWKHTITWQGNNAGTYGANWFIRFKGFVNHVCDFKASAKITKAPTKTATGTRVCTCSCGKTKTQTIPAIPYTTDLAEGIYSISTKGNSNLRVATNPGSGYNVFIADGNYADQYWLFRKNSDGTYTIENAINDNKVLDVEGISMTNDANIHAWDSHGGNNQRFYIVPTGGYYKLVAKHSYLNLDNYCNRLTSGNNIIQFEDNGNDDQRWTLTKSNPVLNLPATSYTVDPGATKTITVTANRTTNGAKITCTSANSNVCFVAYGIWNGSSASIQFGGVSAGTAKLTVTLSDASTGIVYSTKTITVTVPGYNVNYNANGGQNPPASQTKTRGKNLTLSSAKPSRTGYTFKNWNTAANGTGTSYAAGATYSADANVTLYAQWTPVTYQVKYNANGGSNPPAAQTKTYGKSLTLSSAKPSRTGYRFTGWNTAANGTGTAYAPGGAYTGNAALTLYAQWSGVDCTATFNANAGAFAADAVTSKTVPFGSAITADGIAAPIREHYDFLGWSRSPGATAPASLGAMDNLAGVTVYAVWRPTAYTISFDANGGTNAPAVQTKTYDTTITLRSETPAREDYVFLGWATAANAETPEYQPGGSYSGAGDQTLYAVWAPAHYTISFDANGGTDAPDSIVKDYGVDVNLSDQIPVRSGYTFRGWAGWDAFPDAHVGLSKGSIMSTIYAEPAYQAGDVYSANENVTLYAVWEGDLLIHYDSMDGEGAPQTQTVAAGRSLQLSGKVPTKASAVFDGWATSATATEPTYQPGDYFTGTETVTLYALWTEYDSDQFVIYFDAKGGTMNPSYVIGNKTGEAPQIPVQPPRKPGYAFRGWKTSSFAALLPSLGTTYYPGDYYDKRETKTLYASWTSNDTRSYDVRIVTQNVDGPRVSYQSAFDRITILKDYTAFVSYDDAAAALLLRTTEPGTPVYASYEIPAGAHLNEEASILSASDNYPYLRIVIERNPHTVTFCNEDGTPASSVIIPCGVYMGNGVPHRTREGYTFLGWSEDGETVFDTSQPMPDRDLTLYPLWERNEYTVTFQFGNVNGKAVFFSSRQYAGTEILAPEIPTIEGYTFSYLESSDSQINWMGSFNGDTFSPVPEVMPAHDVHVILYYTPNEHTITYLLNGEEDISYLLEYGSEVDDTKPHAVTGYTWTDWEFTPPLQDGRMPDCDVVATATSTVNSHTVTWNFDGNTYEESFDYGSAIRDFVPPEMEGCTFEGWTPAVPDMMPDEDVELTAVYSLNTYKLKWKVNGITFSQNYTYGDPIIPMTEPEMEGYTFVAWDPYVPETMPSYDLEITADWQHIHDIIVVEGNRDATCVDSGYTGDLYCTTCGERVDFGNEVPAFGHSFETSETYEGGKRILTHTCTVCGYVTQSGDNGRRVITLQQLLETLFNRLFAVLFRLPFDNRKR